MADRQRSFLSNRISEKKRLQEAVAGHRTGLPDRLLRLFAPRAPLPPYKGPPKKPPKLPYTGIAQYVQHFAEPGQEEYEPPPPETRPPEPRIFRNPELSAQARVDIESKVEKDLRVRQDKQQRAAEQREENVKGWDPSKDPNVAGDPFKTLFVARLSYDVTERRLKREFEEYGPIKSIRLVHDKNSGKPCGYAFIEYEHKNDMKQAYKLADGRKIEDKRVLVDVELFLTYRAAYLLALSMRGRQRKSQRRLFAEQAPDTELGCHTSQNLHINDLPEPILLEIFRHLGTLPPVTTLEEAALYTRALPFKTFEHPGECHPGLRSYPFLAQVCRHWKAALECPAALQLWQELVVDFGHELVTGVHVPVAWSDVRPTDAEFRQAFAAVRLRSYRLVEFVQARRRVLRRLVLTNSEGYWAEDGEFVPLANKHDFNLGTLGIVLGMVEGLQELQITHCNDLFAGGSPLSTIAMLRGLRSLALEDLQCRLYREQLEELGRLSGLQELSICATQRQGTPFIFGLDTIPDAWRHLSCLTSLELRGNPLLEALPPWLATALPALRLLDVGGCVRLDLRCLTTLTQLETLALQALDLVCDAAPPRLLAQAAQHGVMARVRLAPDLSPLTRLRALNLADNNLGAPPPWLPKLRGLKVLDMSGNFFLQAPQPLTPLTALTNLRHLDLRAIHVEEGTKFWSEAKCVTMQHVAALARALRRRNRHCRLLHDTS